MKANPAKVYQVSEINATIKSIINDKPELKNIWVKGEISNYSSSSGGHIYFSLKDPASVIRCTFFSYANKNYKHILLEDGKEIQVYGSVSVYEQGGTYNINVTKVEVLGEGDLLLKIEKLKRELQKKGIFDPERKRRLPRLPKTLGVATSLYGAALADIMRIATERYPNINILIAPCQVQGEEAPGSIIGAINELNNPEWEVDVIIAGRGGGSIEDLMAFNDERVVMAFYNSRVPIVSAVGHQIDSLLTDFAADNYAPTPTAAAELVVPEIEELEVYLEDLEVRLNQALQYKLNLAKDRLRLIASKRVLTEPTEILSNRTQKLDDLIGKISLVGKNFIAKKKSLLQKFDTLPYSIRSLISNKTNSFNIQSEKIENFSPLLTLKRGYSVVRNKNKSVLTSVQQIGVGEEIEVILFQGKLKATIKEKLEN